jgi:hypothetical protein
MKYLEYLRRPMPYIYVTVICYVFFAFLVGNPFWFSMNNIGDRIGIILFGGCIWVLTQIFKKQLIKWWF